MTSPHWYRRRPAVTAALGMVLLATGCSFGEPDDDPGLAPPQFPSPSPSGDPDQRTGRPELTGAHDVIVTGLNLPWDIDFLPDGTALVTERDTARILRVEPGSGPDDWRVSEVQTIEGVDAEGEGGLLGIAVSPEYEADGWVFAYHSTGSDNRIVRFQLGEEPEPIRTGIPHAGNHNGGRLAFGPDGYLYAGTGDGAQPSRSQDVDSLGGKILRLTVDGDPAPGNPFGDACEPNQDRCGDACEPNQDRCGDACEPNQDRCDSPVWAYGLRNVQGLAWDEADQLWATEFGADDVDELNRIEPGGNYGWPTCEGPCTPAEDDLIDPVVTWPTAEASCSGAAIAGGTLIAACLRGQRLWLVDITESGAVLGAPQPLLVREYGRLRAAVVAPDGSLWVTTSNLDNRLDREPQDADDRIIRLVISGAGGAGMA